MELNLNRPMRNGQYSKPTLTVGDLVILVQETIKYLGMFLCASGVDYEEDIASKQQKVMHSASIIAWTKYHMEFRQGYSSFFKSCVLPILGYGCELYSEEQLNKLEKIRRSCMKKIHSGRYRYQELCNEYLDMYHYNNNIYLVIFRLRQLVVIPSLVQMIVPHYRAVCGSVVLL